MSVAGHYTCPICGKKSSTWEHDRQGYPEHWSKVGFMNMSGAFNGVYYNGNFPCSFQCAAELALSWKGTFQEKWESPPHPCSEQWKCDECAGGLMGDLNLVEQWGEDFPRQAFTLDTQSALKEWSIDAFKRFCSLECMRKFCLKQSPAQ